MRFALRAPILVRRLVPALLLSAIGILAGCGGQSGGAPSGIAGALTNVKINLKSFSTKTATSTTTSAGDLFYPSENAQSGKVTIKGASVNREDVRFYFNVGNSPEGTPIDLDNDGKVDAYQYETPITYPVRTGNFDVVIQYYDQAKSVVIADDAAHANHPELQNGVARITNGYLFDTTIGKDEKVLPLVLKSTLNDPTSAHVQSGDAAVAIDNIPNGAQSVLLQLTEEAKFSSEQNIVFSRIVNRGSGWTDGAAKLASTVWFANRQRRLTFQAKAFSEKDGFGTELGSVGFHDGSGADTTKSVSVLPDVDAGFSGSDKAKLTGRTLLPSITAIETTTVKPSFPSAFTVQPTAKLYGAGNAVPIPTALLTFYAIGDANEDGTVDSTANDREGDKKYIKYTSTPGPELLVISEKVPTVAADQPIVFVSYSNGQAGDAGLVKGQVNVTLQGSEGTNAKLRLEASALNQDGTAAALSGAYSQFTVIEDNQTGAGPGATYRGDLGASRDYDTSVADRLRTFTFTGNLYSDDNGSVLLATSSLRSTIANLPAVSGDPSRSLAKILFDNSSNKVTALSGLLLASADLGVNSTIPADSIKVYLDRAVITDATDVGKKSKSITGAMVNVGSANPVQIPAGFVSLGVLDVKGASDANLATYRTMGLPAETALAKATYGGADDISINTTSGIKLVGKGTSSVKNVPVAILATYTGVGADAGDATKPFTKKKIFIVFIRPNKGTVGGGIN